MQLIDYRDLCPAQREQLIEIEVLAEQVRFAGDIASALYRLLSVDSDDRRGVVLLMNSEPKAFMLLERRAFLPAWADPQAIMLSALQVDRRCQGRGAGRFCMAALPSMARSLWPDARRLELSVAADNQAAIALYLSTGWVDAGNGYRGRIDYERRLILRL